MKRLILFFAFTTFGFSQNYYLYVAAESDDTVSLIKFDGKSATELERIPVGIKFAETEGPHGLTVDPSGDYWYLSLAHGNPYGTLTKFSTKTNTEIAENYLDVISLDAGDRQAAEHDDAAQLMTLHSAKGLEFKLVLMTGLEETLFPHGRSMENPGQLQEERRLCYVGITRAMEKLYITHAESRRLHGSDTFNPPSRFIKEIPKELINEIRPRAQTHIPYNRKDFKETKLEFEDEIGISLGQRVMHKSFGEGVVLNYEGSGESARVQINFDQAGTKWLVMAYANLEKL